VTSQTTMRDCKIRRIKYAVTAGSLSVA